MEFEFKQKTLFIDVETTGLPPRIDVPGKKPGTIRKEQVPYETGYMQYPYIVGMAWAIDDGPVTEYIFNQEGREIPEEASDIHGITTSMAYLSEYTFNQGLIGMLVDVDEVDIVVGHGLYFDISIIKANILKEIDLGEAREMKDRLNNLDYEHMTNMLHKYKRIDTMRSTCKMMRKWPTLEELYMKIFRRSFEGAHTAKGDVIAVRECYKWLLLKGIVPTFEELQQKAEEKEKALDKK